jgi:hypothetical protein
MKRLFIRASSSALFVLLAASTTLSAGAFIEIGTGYTIPLGGWGEVYGSGMTYGGAIGFTFGEFANPGVSGFLLFPSVGSAIQDEYERVHDTPYISLFGVTSLVALTNRAFIALSEKNILTLELGYGIFSQRDYVTIENSNYGSVDNLAGHGVLFGFGLQRAFDFSVFDFIQPFLKCYYAPNRVTYHVIGPGGSSITDYDAGDNRLGIIAGFSLISIGEE